MKVLIIVLIIVVVLALLGLAMSVRIIKQYEEGVLFRFGRVQGPRAPGLRLIIPFADVLRRVSLRIVTMPIQSQGIITRDNVSVDVSAVAYFRVTDAVTSVVAIEDVNSAIDQIAQTTLRKVVGQHSLDQTLSETDKINLDIRKILDVSTVEWGVEVTLVELKDIQLPDTMKRAMARQAEAEREKRAKIINAEGESLAAAALGEASDTMMAHPLALQLRNLQSLVEIGVDKNTTVVFPAPLMTTIAELGSFLAGEKAAAAAGPRAPGRQARLRLRSRPLTEPVPTGPLPLERPGPADLPRWPAPRMPDGPANHRSIRLPGRIVMRRRTFDLLMASAGLFLAITLIAAGGLLTWAHTFIGNEVHTQLAAEQVYFPPSNSPAIKAPEFAAMHQYAGQQLTTGAQAEVYADHFIANHLKVIGGGKTYAQLSAESIAQPNNAKLAAQVATVFKGETLRGLLLNAYAFGTMGTIAGIAAIAAYIAGLVMLVLGALGLMHARRASSATDILGGQPDHTSGPGTAPLEPTVSSGNGLVTTAPGSSPDQTP